MILPENGIPAIPRPSPADQLARYCPWHGDWMSERDRRLAYWGAAVTDSMCPSCEARAYREAGIS